MKGWPPFYAARSLFFACCWRSPANPSLAPALALALALGETALPSLLISFGVFSSGVFSPEPAGQGPPNSV